MYPSDADDDNFDNTVLLYCCLNAQPQEKSNRRDTVPAFVAAMQGMTAEALLKCLADMNVPAAEQFQVEREEARELQTASRKALADASIFHRTNERERTFQTFLTATTTAYDGNGRSRVPVKRKAEILGVYPRHLSAARQRAKLLRPNISPTAAMDEGTYWFRPWSRRSDTTPPELVELMKRFRHTDGVFRATGIAVTLNQLIKKI